MDSAPADHSPRKLLAYTLPIGLFFGALALLALLKATDWLQRPEFWVYPAQTIICGAAVLWFRRDYEWHSLRKPLFTMAIGAGVFLIWISPQAFMGYAPRLEGFDVSLLANSPAAYWATIVMRFARLVLVVPVLEELFWRGFLLRYFINEKFASVPFGAFSWPSFVLVTAGFTLVHHAADWPAAVITGAVYNVVAYRTRSQLSCIVAHAVTNLCLGIWIMRTGQWGFW